MADPETEYGLTYDEDGFVNILQSTFFDVKISFDHTVEDYVERILDTLVKAIEEQFEGAEWRISTDPWQKHWKQEATLNAKKFEFLEASNRELMGENLESRSLEDLNKLEGQLEQNLGKIRGIKFRLLSGQVTHLKEKTRVLSEENELLQNQCEETQLILLDSTWLVTLYNNNNQHKEVETDLYIECLGEDERSSNGRKGDILQSEISNNKGCFLM